MIIKDHFKISVFVVYALSSCEFEQNAVFEVSNVCYMIAVGAQKQILNKSINCCVSLLSCTVSMHMCMVPECPCSADYVVNTLLASLMINNQHRCSRKAT